MQNNQSPNSVYTRRSLTVTLKSTPQEDSYYCSAIANYIVICQAKTIIYPSVKKVASSALQQEQRQPKYPKDCKIW